MCSENKYPLLKKIHAGAVAGFVLPDGYFTQLNKQLSTQLNLVNSTDQYKGFSIPDNYFEELYNKINTEINLPDKNNINELPGDYFNKLSAEIFTKIENEERNEWPILSSAKKGSDFNLPDKYFEELKEKIISRAEDVKIVSINKNKTSFNFEVFKWAAIVIIIFSSGWFIYNSFTKSNNNINKQVAQLQNETFEKIALQELDEENIIDYISANSKEELNTSRSKENSNEEEILQNIDINDLGEAF